MGKYGLKQSSHKEFCWYADNAEVHLGDKKREAEKKFDSFMEFLENIDKSKKYPKVYIDTEGIDLYDNPYSFKKWYSCKFEFDSSDKNQLLSLYNEIYEFLITLNVNWIDISFSKRLPEDLMYGKD